VATFNLHGYGRAKDAVEASRLTRFAKAAAKRQKVIALGSPPKFFCNYCHESEGMSEGMSEVDCRTQSEKKFEEGG
jgi:hypothetical protein